jgi:serine/threonine protein kinase
MPSKNPVFSAGIVIVRSRRNGYVAAEKKLSSYVLHGKYVKRERDILLRVSGHENIVGLLDHKFDPRLRLGSLFLEYCDGGSLADLIDRHRPHQRHGCSYHHNESLLCPHIDEHVIWLILRMLAEGVEYLHHGSNAAPYPSGWKTVLHMDLQPSNLLFKRAPEKPLGFNLLIAGFGSSEVLEPGQTSTKMPLGSRDFTPPEYPYYSTASEVWAIGTIITCLSLMHKRPPCRTPKPSYHCSESLAHLLLLFMAPKPHDRTPSKCISKLIFDTSLDVWRRLPEGQLPNVPHGVARHTVCRDK